MVHSFDWSAILTACIHAGPPTAAVYLAYRHQGTKIGAVHDEVREVARIQSGSSGPHSVPAELENGDRS
jgi:hypothetical protein